MLIDKIFVLIGVVVFFASELIYNQFSVPESTNWIIFYYAFHYLAIAIICADQSLFNDIKWIRWFFVIFGILSISYVIIELSLINVPYDEYISGISNRIVSNISLFILTFSFGLISYGLWHKQLRVLFQR